MAERNGFSRELIDAFWSRVDVGRPDDCWQWKMARVNGYGRWRPMPSIGGDGQQWLTHRLAFTIVNGPIQPGMTIDHECFTEACCNPDHLREMTNEENGQRTRQWLSDRCAKGHVYAEVGVNEKKFLATGKRDCRECNRLRMQVVNADRRLARSAA